MKNLLLFYGEELKGLYSQVVSNSDPIENLNETPLGVLSKRFQRLAGVDEVRLLTSDGPKDARLREEATSRGLQCEAHSEAGLLSKPLSYLSGRWALKRDECRDELPGIWLADIFRKTACHHIILVPLENLLVDREALIVGLRLHQSEGFDVTFQGDRLNGAGWIIFQKDLVLGLAHKHPDLMSIRGGIIWAVRSYFYPFKLGIYHTPRSAHLFKADLRASQPRARKVFESFEKSFLSPDFSYDSLAETAWAEKYFDFGPEIVQLEVTNNCQGNCVYCPQPSLKRPKAELDISLIEKLSLEAPQTGNPRFVISGLGEPFEHSCIREILSTLQNSHIHIITSGNKIDTRILKPVDVLTLSVDALEANMYEAIRTKLSWDNLYGTMQKLIAKKSELGGKFPEIGVRFMKFELNDDQAFGFLNYWKKVCTSPSDRHFLQYPPGKAPDKIQFYQIIGYSRFLQFLPVRHPICYTPLKRRPCEHALSRATILANGEVVLCRFDIEGIFSLGNLHQSSLKEIWSSDEAQRIRREQLKNEFSRQEKWPCENCQDWYHIWD